MYRIVCIRCTGDTSRLHKGDIHIDADHDMSSTGAGGAAIGDYAVGDLTAIIEQLMRNDPNRVSMYVYICISYLCVYGCRWRPEGGHLAAS